MNVATLALSRQISMGVSSHARIAAAILGRSSRTWLLGLSVWLCPMMAQAVSIEYREVFGNSGGGDVTMASKGWQAHGGATATHQSTNASTFPVSQGAGRPDNLANVNAGPIVINNANGYGAKRAGSFGIAWTEEYAIDRDTFDINAIRFWLNNSNADEKLRVAIRIDSQSTLADTADDEWFASSATFSRGGGTPSNFPTNGAQRTLNFSTNPSDWLDLTFTPGTSLALGGTLGANLPDGKLTGFGLYNESNTGVLRFDAFEIQATPVGGPTINPIALAQFNAPKTLTFESVSAPTTISGTDPLFTDFGITQISATGGGGSGDMQNQTNQSGNALFFNGASLWVLPQGDNTVAFGSNQDFTLDFAEEQYRFGLSFQDQVAQNIVFSFFLDGVLQGEYSQAVALISDAFYGFETDFPFNRVVINGVNAGDGIGLDNLTIEAVPEPSTLALAVLGLGCLAYRRGGRGCENA